MKGKNESHNLSNLIADLAVCILSNSVGRVTLTQSLCQTLVVQAADQVNAPSRFTSSIIVMVRIVYDCSAVGLIR